MHPFVFELSRQASDQSLDLDPFVEELERLGAEAVDALRVFARDENESLFRRRAAVGVLFAYGDQSDLDLLKEVGFAVPARRNLRVRKAVESLRRDADSAPEIAEILRFLGVSADQLETKRLVEVAEQIDRRGPSVKALAAWRAAATQFDAEGKKNFWGRCSESIVKYLDSESREVRAMGREFLLDVLELKRAHFCLPADKVSWMRYRFTACAEPGDTPLLHKWLEQSLDSETDDFALMSSAQMTSVVSTLASFGDDRAGEFALRVLEASQADCSVPLQLISTLYSGAGDSRVLAGIVQLLERGSMSPHCAKSIGMALAHVGGSKEARRRIDASSAPPEVRERALSGIPRESARDIIASAIDVGFLARHPSRDQVRRIRTRIGPLAGAAEVFSALLDDDGLTVNLAWDPDAYPVPYETLLSMFSSASGGVFAPTKVVCKPGTLTSDDRRDTDYSIEFCVGRWRYSIVARSMGTCFDGYAICDAVNVALRDLKSKSERFIPWGEKVVYATPKSAEELAKERPCVSKYLGRTERVRRPYRTRIDGV